MESQRIRAASALTAHSSMHSSCRCLRSSRMTAWGGRPQWSRSWVCSPSPTRSSGSSVSAEHNLPPLRDATFLVGLVAIFGFQLVNGIRLIHHPNASCGRLTQSASSSSCASSSASPAPGELVGGPTLGFDHPRPVRSSRDSPPRMRQESRSALYPHHITAPRSRNTFSPDFPPRCSTVVGSSESTLAQLTAASGSCQLVLAASMSPISFSAGRTKRNA